jgi:hypothetical protein
MVTRARNNVSKPKNFIDGTIQYPLPCALLAESSPTDLEPICFSSVVKDANCRQAMNVEFDALLKKYTWTLVPFDFSYQHHWVQMGIPLEAESRWLN